MVPQPRPGAVKVVAAPESCAGFVAGPGVAVSVRGATVSVGRRVAVAMGGVAVAVVAALVPPVVAAAAPVVVPPVVVAPALLAAAAAPGLVPALAAVRLLAAPPVPAVPAAAAAAGLVLVAGAGAREALVAASAAATSATEVVTAPLPVVVRVALVSSPLRSSSVIIHSGGLLSPQPLQFFFLALQSLSLKPLPLSFELHEF